MHSDPIMLSAFWRGYARRSVLKSADDRPEFLPITTGRKLIVDPSLAQVDAQRFCPFTTQDKILIFAPVAKGCFTYVLCGRPSEASSIPFARGGSSLNLTWVDICETGISRSLVLKSFSSSLGIPWPCYSLSKFADLNIPRRRPWWAARVFLSFFWCSLILMEAPARWVEIE